RCVPGGVLKVIEYAYHLRASRVTRISQPHLEALLFERNSLERKIECSEVPQKKALLESMLLLTNTRIEYLERELGRKHAWLSNLVFLLCLTVVMVLSVALVTRMVLYCLALITGWGDIDRRLPNQLREDTSR
ncbi:hypothetical protein SARC_15850, partial [Sphaeroforma arctica JP610]